MPQVTYNGVVHNLPDDATEQEIADILRGTDAIPDGEILTEPMPEGEPYPTPGVMGGTGLALRVAGPKIVTNLAPRAAATGLRMGAGGIKLVAGGLGASYGAGLAAPAGLPFAGAHTGAVLGGKLGAKIAKPLTAAADYLAGLVPQVARRNAAGQFVAQAGKVTAARKAGQKLLGFIGKRLVPGLGTGLLAADALNTGRWVGSKIDDKFINTPENKTTREREALEAEMLRLQADPTFRANTERARTGKF